MNPIYLIFACIPSTLYIWTLYSVPTVVVGVKHLRRARQSGRKAPRLKKDEFPTVSIMVPVKNEERVVGRLLRALLNLELNSPSSLRFPKPRSIITSGKEFLSQNDPNP